MNLLVPYVGATDFLNFEQVRAMLKVFNAHLPKGSKRRLHVGVMTDLEMVYDASGPEARWAHLWPRRQAWRGIFASAETYNCLHYANYITDYALAGTLSEAIGHCGMHLSAVQLDMIWPHPTEVRCGMHMSRRFVEIILQVGTEALDECNNDPAEVVKRLEDYEGVIHRVLLDKSAGKGLGMDAAALLPFARAIRARFPKLGLVFAGGLGPTTMSLVDPLLPEFSDMSIDAQGKLHPSGNWKSDHMDVNLAADYLVAALKRLP